MYALFEHLMTTSDVLVFIVDSASESALAFLKVLLVWASTLFVIACRKPFAQPRSSMTKKEHAVL
jgi:hypothetical protein